MATFFASIAGLYRDLDNDSTTDPTFDGVNPPPRFEFTLNSTFIDEVFAQPDSIQITGDNNATLSFFGWTQMGGNQFMVLAGTGGSRSVYGNAGPGFQLPDTLDISAVRDSLRELTRFDDNWTGSGNSNAVDLLEGNDIARGRGGADIIHGNEGKDSIHGNGGNDLIFGGSGADVLWGERGRDILDGGAGDDDLMGGKHNDTLNGGAGNDMLTGGNGRDELFGGVGKDKLDGGAGNDELTGGGKADQFIFRGDFGDDSILDFTLAGKAEVVDFSRIGAIAGLKDLKNNHATEVAGNTVIDDGSGNTVTLLNIGIDDLSKNDFLFN